MKHFLFSSFLSLSLAFCSVAQPLKAYLTYSRFLSPESGPYIETYITVVGNSVVYTKNESGKFQGIIEVAVEFMKEDSIIYSDKYNLLSLEVDSIDSEKPNFIDLQRISLPGGIYDFVLRITDKSNTASDTVSGSSGKTIEHKEAIIIDFSTDSVSISDIEAIE